MAGTGAFGVEVGAGDAQPDVTQRPVFGGGNVRAGCGVASVSEVATTMPTLTANHGVSIAPRTMRPYSGREPSRLIRRRRSRVGTIGCWSAETTGSGRAGSAGREVVESDSCAGAAGWAGTVAPLAGDAGWTAERDATEEAAGGATTGTAGGAAVSAGGGATEETAAGATAEIRAGAIEEAAAGATAEIRAGAIEEAAAGATAETVAGTTEEAPASGSGGAVAARCRAAPERTPRTGQNP
ncbi:MAG TPA: hypothetical protein VFW16_05595 [Streptosporangiaceae bacterium]|nr:hypothetical protein [Streptosporangiaceae bacterium]